MKRHESLARRRIGAAERADAASLSQLFDAFVLSLEQGSAAHEKEIARIAATHGQARAKLGRYELRDVIEELRLLGQLLSAETAAASREARPPERLEERIEDAVDLAVTSAATAFVHARTEAERRHLMQIADSVPVHLVYLDRDERILFMNRAAASSWRLEPAQAVGKSVREVIGPEGQRALRSFSERVLRGEDLTYETPFHLPDGSVRHFLNHYTPARAKDGSIDGFIATGTDMTEIKSIAAKLAFERHQLEAVFEKAPAAMALWRGPKMVFERVNPQYQAFFPGRELLGKPFLEALPEFEDQPFMELLTRVYETGEPYFGHESLARHRRTEDGPLEDHYYDFAYVRIVDHEGRAYGVYDHAIDVTERVRARQAMEQERELRERFVATLSHDLRTPLTAAKMSAQLLQRKAARDPGLSRHASKVIDSLDRADAMIRDLLDANRIKAGERIALEFDECDLRRLASDTIDELTTVHGDRFELRAPEELPGRWSCNAVRRIIENLCSNAIKYGSADRKVRVAMGADGASGPGALPTRAWIEVHNDGNPIPPEELPRIFDPFKRTSTARRARQRGWGLGLTLVKGFAEAHGGHVSVESSEAEGTCFRVELPIEQPRHQAADVLNP